MEIYVAVLVANRHSLQYIHPSIHTCTPAHVCVFLSLSFSLHFSIPSRSQYTECDDEIRVWTVSKSKNVDG